MSKYFEITTSGNIGKTISSAINDIKNHIENVTDEYVRTVAEIFVERAKQKLKDSKYKNTEILAENIKFAKTKGPMNYRVYFALNKDKETMFYLEFGTGFVGRSNPHKMASKFGWKYAINENATFDNGMPMYFDLTKPVGQQGLYSIDAPTPTGKNSLGEDVGSKGWIYRDEQTGTLVATSGLKAVSYMYNTLLEIEDIKLEAERRIKNGK